MAKTQATLASGAIRSDSKPGELLFACSFSEAEKALLAAMDLLGMKPTKTDSSIAADAKRREELLMDLTKPIHWAAYSITGV